MLNCNCTGQTGRISVLALALLLAGCGGAAITGAKPAATAGVPAVITFATAAHVALLTTIVSPSGTLSGFTLPAAISVSSGSQYQLDSGSWTSVSGVVSTGQKVQVKHSSASTYSTNMVSSLTVGGVTSSFTSTTVAALETPTLVNSGLTWTQDNFNATATWTAANTYCTTTTINGTTSWRLPTSTELIAMRVANPGTNLGWTLVGLWSSDAVSAGFHNQLAMNNASAAAVSTDDTALNYFSCVHS